MKAKPSLLANIDLATSASLVTTTSLDHLPLLISDRCLENAAGQLVSYAKASLAAGSPIISETITMPRKGFGPRPVTLTTAASRTLYGALVKNLEDDLPESSRGGAKYNQYQAFGLDGQQDYVAEIDIASCYEYIDHAYLRDELLLRSMKVDTCEATVAFLQELFGRPRGLPQMQYPSDRLADAYLSVLERRLVRDGRSVFRYADDIRVCAEGWSQANQIIEDAAEYARELGLILSSQKTAIYKKATLISRQQADANFLNANLRNARRALTKIIRVAVGGGIYEGPEWEEEEIEPGAVEALHAACWKILHDWWSKAQKSEPETQVNNPIQGPLLTALIVCMNYDERLDDRLLRDFVFHNPQRLEHVCRYVASRAERSSEDHWSTLRSLINMGRQSPWAKLWFLDTIEKLNAKVGDIPLEISEWVSLQLSDRHEVVRAHASWIRAIDSKLTSSELGSLYRKASPMTQPALSAAAARQVNMAREIRNAIEDDNPLNREAAAWAQP
ncbi:RNA-directed DNA polymerase [Spirillospora sp. NPDC048824]|uniref:RNA-directed DNA polymerase n=1 Tax=Spirillospora sp. NPDC048824 TaxID=3364526 RepID=UPI003721A68C